MCLMMDEPWLCSSVNQRLLLWQIYLMGQNSDKVHNRVDTWFVSHLSGFTGRIGAPVWHVLSSALRQTLVILLVLNLRKKQPRPHSPLLAKKEEFSFKPNKIFGESPCLPSIGIAGWRSQCGQYWCHPNVFDPKNAHLKYEHRNQYR